MPSNRSIFSSESSKFRIRGNLFEPQNILGIFWYSVMGPVNSLGTINRSGEGYMPGPCHMSPTSANAILCLRSHASRRMYLAIADFGIECLRKKRKIASFIESGEKVA